MAEHQPITKCCTACGAEKSVSEFFPRSDLPGKFRQPCRACYHYVRRDDNVERARRWRAEDPGRSRASMKRWRASHPEHNAERYARDKVKILTRGKQQRQKHLEKRSAKRRAMALHKTPAVKAYMRAYVRANPEKFAEYHNRRRARKLAAGGTHTAADIKRLYELQRGKCAACRCDLKKYHVDHVIPLSGGGSNDRLNLQLLCQTCNQRKGARDPVKFMQEQGYLL